MGEASRDDWARRRIFQLEHVIELMLQALEMDNRDDRDEFVSRARSEMPK